MIVGTLAMMAIGSAVPVNLYFFGNLMTNFIVAERVANADVNTTNKCIKPVL